MDLQLVFEQNPHSLLNEDSVRNVLRDIYPGDNGSVNVMVMAYSSINIINEIIRGNHQNLDNDKRRWVIKLQKDYCLLKSKAVWAVDEWSTVFSPTLTQLIPALQNKALFEKKAEEIHTLICKEQYDIAESKLIDLKKMCANKKLLTDEYNSVIMELQSDLQCNSVRCLIADSLLNGKYREAQQLMDESKTLSSFIADWELWKYIVTTELLKEKSLQYVSAIEKQISQNNYNEAENILREAEKLFLNDKLFALRTKIDENKIALTVQQQQAISEFQNEHWTSYESGIKRIAHILDLFPQCEQAKIWLAQHVRTSGVNQPLLRFTPGERQCTIIWKDDDSFTKYTVCRAENRYPRDPNDGVQICKEITNKKVTDTLPLDKPGLMWQYSIFAVRVLDGQWTKTDCPKEAVWLPSPSNVKAEIIKNDRNYPEIQITWETIPIGCMGVQISRYDSEDGYFSYSTSKLDPKTENQLQVQRLCCFTDNEVEKGVTYRYVLNQVWKKGHSFLLSSAVTIEKTVS